MGNLLKQLGVRFSGQESEEVINTTGRRIPPQKAVSFKGDKETSKNWLQRQLSGRMSHGGYCSDGELETAVAAAAYAINSLAEEGSLNKRKVEGLGKSATRAKSQKENTATMQEDAGRITRWFTGKEGKEADKADKEKSTINQKMPEKGMSMAPSFRKTSTFGDKRLTDTESKKFETEKEKPTRISTESTKADAWEKAEMDKIKKRHEKTNVTILEWEDEKKKKAKRRLERKESKLEERRARALQEYRNDISRIDKIAGGARSLADERKRNEESKTREKANEIRLKGEVPKTCFCF